MRFTTLSLVLLLLLPLLGCGESIDHYARAVAIERELLRADEAADYENPRYVLILRELNEVPLRDGKRDEADAMARRIMDGRRVLLGQVMPQVDHLPKRLAGRDVPTRARQPATPAAAPALTQNAESLDITLYSTSWCGYCRKARSWFTKNGIPFAEKDIEKDPAAAAEYRAKGQGYSGVPLIDVNGTAVRGFDQRRIEGLIAAVR